MRGAIFGAFLSVAFCAAGCTKSEQYQEVMREQRKAFEETADILAKVHDEKTMQAARAALDERKERFEKIARKAKSLPPPSQEEMQRYEYEQYLFKQTFERYNAERRRILELKLPVGEEFLNHFQSDSQPLLKAVQP